MEKSNKKPEIKAIITIPLYKSISLVIFENWLSTKRGVKIMLDSLYDETQQEYTTDSSSGVTWQDDIDLENADSEDTRVEISIEIDEKLLDEIKSWCLDVGVSVEQMTVAFLRFCACPDNHDALRKWFHAQEYCSDCKELARVKAELAEVKQRFGLDKQEAFLEAHANITVKEFALMLHGRDCQPNLSQNERLLAKQRGFVVVYGDSDDRVEFDGAIRAEGHTNPLVKDNPAGVLALTKDGLLLDKYSDLYAEYVKENRNVISVYYCCKDGLNWVFETDIPHETFLTYDGGYDEDFADFDDGFARCMVFEVSALK